MKKDLMQILACPVCKGDLILEEEQIQEFKRLLIECNIKEIQQPILNPEQH